MSSEVAGETTAEVGRVVLSYPADLTSWDREQLDTPWYRGYLRKILEEPEIGEVFEEFVDIGCCGSSRRVPLAVEELEGDGSVGETTSIEYIEREACDLPDAWEVQSGDSRGTQPTN